MAGRGRNSSTMTLGELISALKRKAPDAQVRFDFVYFRPDGSLHSWRGDYSQLALGYTSAYPNPVTVEKLVMILDEARGKTFTGWKGGEYTMHDETPVWVSNANEAALTGIVDVHDEGDVILETAMLDW